MQVQGSDLTEKKLFAFTDSALLQCSQSPKIWT